MDKRLRVIIYSMIAGLAFGNWQNDLMAGLFILSFLLTFAMIKETE